MTPNKFQIKIESILGGQSQLMHFAAGDQFMASIGINPAYPRTDNAAITTSIKPTGLLRPVNVTQATGSVIADTPMWIIDNPKTMGLFVYGSAGSVYTYNAIGTGVTAALGDLNDGGSATGNGAAYYDNYIYLARDTTVARYGPLDGIPVFTDDYWVTTLGKTALVNTDYPNATSGNNYSFPNHILHRHSDGKLYIADVVGNKGTIHYISTAKTTVEGDTDNGSAYSKLQVGYGLWPTAIESYGSDLAIAFVESNNQSGISAKLAFWDTTSQNVNQIVWVEFPDRMITAMKNVNGTLYVISSDPDENGFRVSRFIGGYNFEDVAINELGIPILPGAIDGKAGQLVFGSGTQEPAAAGGVWSLGLAFPKMSNGLFHIIGLPTLDNVYSSQVTALKLINDAGFNNYSPTMGWNGGGQLGTNWNGLSVQARSGFDYTKSLSYFWSQIYKIGKPFKITKVRIPLAQAVVANMGVTIQIYTDDGAGTTYTLAAINNTNDPGKFNIVRRSGSAGQVITGQHNFWLSFTWTGSALCVIGLPIEIEYELIDD